MANNKTALRKKIYTQRKLRTSTTLAKLNQSLLSQMSHVLDLIADYTDLSSWINVNIGAYYPTASELGSIDLLNFLANKVNHVFLPIVTYSPDTPMQWGKYIPNTPLVTGAFNILQPPEIIPDITINNFTFIIIPALAVNYHGDRLGKGKGYYDLTLANAKTTLIKIAFCFDEEIIPELFPSSHDIPMDLIVTPNQVIICNKKLSKSKRG